MHQRAFIERCLEAAFVVWTSPSHLFIWISFIELGRWGVECIYKKIPFIFHRFWTLLMS